jgi:acyl-coenzyme A synthetase/AMP-(fatty) acid ligase
LLAAGARLKDCAAEYNRFRVGHTASSEWEGNLKEHVRHTLGSMAIPSEIAFVEKLPRRAAARSCDGY